MSLEIIYGKSGTGKSTYIFNEIARKVEDRRKNREFAKKIYIITPEQFSFTAEKKLMDTIKTNAITDAEVVTFNRMAYRIINETRRADSQTLSACGKSMLLFNILLDKKKELKFIGKSNENVELVSKQITEFKKHGITTNILEDTMKKTEDEYLKAKIQDMLTIYEKYDEQISNQYIDENDCLSILAMNLDKANNFKKCDIYIDEFVGFTKQEYEIIRALLKNENDIHITVCTDDIDMGTNPDTDIFYTNKNTLDKIFQIAKQEDIKIEKPVLLDKNYRFKVPELKHLEENIYAVPYKKYTNQIKNIELFLAKNQYSEIEHIGAEIVKLVRDHGYRYNEISVITKDLEGYASLCKVILNKYHIPVFIDEKKDLNQNILVRYILAILNIFAQNWTYESVFEYLKTGFIQIDSMDINLLENYCLKWGIRGKKWYQEEWNFYNESDDEKEKILHVRNTIVPPLLKFKEELINKKDVKGITEAIYNFLIENEIDKKLEQKIIELTEIGELEKAKEYETSWKVIVDVLDEMIYIFGDKKITFEKYADILKIGLGNSGLGKIPASQDQVIVGDVDRSRSHKVKAVFIIGLNDGMFPSVNRNEGFFNDKDREKLKNEGTELAKGILEKLYDDNFNIYKSFSTAEEKLYLSYSSADLEGRSLRSSMIINRLKKIFPELTEKSDVMKKQNEILTEEISFEELLDKLRILRDEGKFGDDNDFKNDSDLINQNQKEVWQILYNYYKNNEQWKNQLENSMKALNYTNEPDKINEELIEKLYGNTLKTSISKLEQYKSCPFSYHLKYGLKLSDRNELKIEAIDTGTFMHDVIDEFFETIEEKNISVKQITDNQIRSIVSEIVEQKLQLKQNYIFTSIPKYRVLAARLKKVIQKSMKYIVDSLKYSKFEVLGHEMEFKQGKEYDPICISLDNGKKIEITGKIDRLDIAKTVEGNYIRVIDYKSSIKDINLNEVVAGLQLQLLTYLDAVCESNQFLPAGVLYFNLIDPTIKASSHMTDEEIESEIRKQFKMKGFILADVEVAKMMDTKVENGKSDIIPAYIDKDGNLGSRSNAITRKEFESLQKYTKKMIKQISTKILTGNIETKPYYKIKGGKTPCEYCKYKSICNFNNGICKNSYYYVGNLNKEAILSNISDEEKQINKF